jgi:hypothetical protein
MVSLRHENVVVSSHTTHLTSLHGRIPASFAGGANPWIAAEHREHDPRLGLSRQGAGMARDVRAATLERFDVRRRAAQFYGSMRI